MSLVTFGIDSATHQAPSTDNLPRGPTFRRRYPRINRKVPPQSHLTPKARVSRGRRFVVPQAGDPHETGYDERMAGVETRKPRDPVFGSFAKKVWELSCSPTHATESNVDVQLGCYGEEETKSASGCWYRRGAFPDYV